MRLLLCRNVAYRLTPGKTHDLKLAPTFEPDSPDTVQRAVRRARGGSVGCDGEDGSVSDAKWRGLSDAGSWLGWAASNDAHNLALNSPGRCNQPVLDGRLHRRRDS